MSEGLCPVCGHHLHLLGSERCGWHDCPCPHLDAAQDCVLGRFGLTPHSHRCTADEDRAALAAPEGLDVEREPGDDLEDWQRLVILAAWFDMWDRPETDRQAILDDPRNPGRNDVQRDLRRIAADLRARLRSTEAGEASNGDV